MPKVSAYQIMPTWRVIADAVVIVLGCAVAVWFIQTWARPSGDFRHGLWAPIYLLMHGKSPYLESPLFDNVHPVWLPPAIGLFAPLGALSEQQATNTWLVFNTFLIVWTVWTQMGKRHPSPVLFVLCLLMAFLFVPTLSHLALGQFSLFVMTLLLVAAHFISMKRYTIAGFLAAISLTKPQLAILAVPGLLLGSARLGSRRAAIEFAASVVVSALTLTLPLWLFNPTWVRDFLPGLTAILTWAQPNPYSILTQLYGPTGLIIWAFGATCIFAMNCWLWLKLSPTRAIIPSLALTTITSPYIWTWDFVLLLPLMIAAFTQLETKIAQIVLLGGIVVATYSAFWLRMTAVSEQFFWWLPLAIITAVGIGFVVDLVARGRLGNGVSLQT